MKSLLLLCTLAAALTGCQRQLGASTASVKGDCIDASRIKPDAICTMQYDPVCGCDGKTYSNACTAQAAGVRTYQPGACAPR